MKTADKILYTALSLFNEHGENSVTSVDIAMELDISPGNLYYHYKGKEVIVERLISIHKNQMLHVLRSDIAGRISAEDVFYYFYMIIEKLHLFEFLYRSPADLAEKYPHAHKVRNQVVSALEKQISNVLYALKSSGSLTLEKAELPLLTELLTLVLTQSFQYDQLGRSLDGESQRYHCLSLLMMSLLPRLTLPEGTLAELNQGIARHSLANLKHTDWTDGKD